MKLAGKDYEIHLPAIIVLYVLGFAVYLNSFPVPFVFDDYPNIHDNTSIRLTSIDIESLRAAAVESHAPRRPIANVSFALNYLAGGYDVKGYHLVNIFIHVANGALVYFLVPDAAAPELGPLEGRSIGVEPAPASSWPCSRRRFSSPIPRKCRPSPTSCRE